MVNLAVKDGMAIVYGNMKKMRVVVNSLRGSVKSLDILISFVLNLVLT